MLRKLAIAIAASGAMMSASTIHALGMGDIELDSALNQPLNARIKLLKASELENWEIKPDLASRDEFEKSGVERVFFLNSLKFEVIRDGADVYVDVSSDQPVVEPFLNFLVQVDWPNGRLLREYTLLLDPPVFEEESYPAEVQAPQEQFEEDGFDEESAAFLPGVGVSSQADDVADIPDFVEEDESTSEVHELNNESDDVADIPDYTAAEEESLQSDSAEAVLESAPESEPQVYQVQANDTLWEVAVETRANRSISPQQAMLAIQDLNPDAFINGNINRLKKNQVLRVPTEDQMLSRSFDEAVADVAMQNQAFAQRKAQLDATRKEAAMARTGEVSDGKLTLLASGEASSETDRGASGRVDSDAAGDQSSIENELNLALENLDKSTRENQELRARLDSMEEQINTLQRLINLKDEQMVALQTGMAAPEESLSEEDVKAAMAAPSDEVTATDALDKDTSADQDLNFQDQDEVDPAVPSEEQAEQKSDKQEDAQAGMKDKATPSQKPKPAVLLDPVVPEEEPFDVIAFAIENPQIPGAAALALLLALMGVSRARKRKEEETEQSLPEMAEMTGEDPLDQLGNDFEDDFDSEFSDLDLGDETAVDDFDGSGFEGETADAGLPDSLDEADSHEGADVLGEVEVYMAYNRIEPAKALLEKTIGEQPSRMDLRLKMMEVLAEIDDEDGLNEQFEAVMAQGSEADKSLATDLKARLGGGSLDHDLSENSQDFDSGLDLDLGGESNDELSGLDLGTEDSELDFDLDGLDLDASADDVPSLDLGESDDSGLDFETDFDTSNAELSLDGLDGEPELDSSDSGIELDLDSGMDLDAGVDLDSETDLDAGVELELGGDDSSDLSMDFDLDLDESATDSSAEVEVDLELDSDGGLDFEVPELAAESEVDDGLGLDLDADDTEISLDSTEELALGGDDLSDLDAGLDIELDSGDDLSALAESSEELPSLDLDDDLNMELDVAEVESDAVEVPDFEEDTSLDLDLSAEDGLAELAEEQSVASDLDLPSLGDVEDDLELPSLDEGSELEVPAQAEQSTGDLPPLDDMDALDGDLDFLSGTDESETKLDLARAYIDMDDQDGAKEILQEVIEEGSDEQKQEASRLMDSMV